MSQKPWLDHIHLPGLPILANRLAILAITIPSSIINRPIINRPKAFDCLLQRAWYPERLGTVVPRICNLHSTRGLLLYTRAPMCRPLLRTPHALHRRLGCRLTTVQPSWSTNKGTMDYIQPRPCLFYPLPQAQTRQPFRAKTFRTLPENRLFQDLNPHPPLMHHVLQLSIPVVTNARTSNKLPQLQPQWCFRPPLVAPQFPLPHPNRAT